MYLFYFFSFVQLLVGEFVPAFCSKDLSVEFILSVIFWSAFVASDLGAFVAFVVRKWRLKFRCKKILLKRDPVLFFSVVRNGG